MSKSKKAINIPNTAPTRLQILQAIFSHFHMAAQSLSYMKHASSVVGYHEYLAKAEALVELLEVQDCGSVGGFDNMIPREKQGNLSLYERFMFLLCKYHASAYIKPECDFTVQSLRDFYVTLSKLRDKAQAKSQANLAKSDHAHDGCCGVGDVLDNLGIP